MTNRQMIMIKLIQLDDEQFAEMLDDKISQLIGDSVCKECMAQNNGECAADKEAVITGCPFDLVSWLRKKAS